MYQWLVERRIRQVFGRLSAGDYEAVLPGMAEDVHHRFAGDHPLGGERHGRAAVALWFGRLYRLFPSLEFDVRSVSVAGPPWALTVCVEWSAQVTPAVGPAYENVGAHVMRLRGSRVRSLHAYEDSQAVATACALMAQAGVAEAGAPPITGNGDDSR